LGKNNILQGKKTKKVRKSTLTIKSGIEKLFHRETVKMGKWTIVTFSSDHPVNWRTCSGKIESSLHLILKLRHRSF